MTHPSERIWNLTQGPENRNYRRKLYRRLGKNPIIKNEGAFREFILSLGNKEGRLRFKKYAPLLDGLIDIHSRAFVFIAEHGRFYTPQVWYKKPNTLPRTGKCFTNAAALMQNLNTKKPNTAVYVEGIAFGEFAEPMLHAWNARSTSDTIALDWTHFAGCRWSRYFGVPLTEDEYWHISSQAYKKKRLAILFHKQHFHRTEPILREILETRGALKPAS